MNKKRIVFTTFLISYIFLAFVIVVILSGVYGRYISLAKERTEQLNLLQLEKNISAFDKELAIIELDINEIPKLKWVRKLGTKGTDLSFFDVVDAQNEFRDTSIMNILVREQFVVFEKNGAVVSKYGSTTDKDEFFSKTLNFTEDIQKIYNENKYMSFYTSEMMLKKVSADDKNVFLNIRRFRDSATNENICYIATAFDADMVNNRLLTNFDNAWLNIYDKNMNLIYGKSDVIDNFSVGKTRLSGDNINFSLKSEYNRWTYVVSIPKDLAYDSLSGIKNIAFIVVFVVIGVILLVGMIFTRKNTQPIFRILDLVEEETSENAYDNIYSYISLLKNDINDLHGYLNKNSDFIQGGVVKKLLDNSFENDEDFRQQCMYAGIDFEDKIFWITALTPDLFHEKNISDVNRQDIISAFTYSVLDKCIEYYPETKYFISRDTNDTIIVLLYIPKSEKRNALKYQNYFEKNIAEQFKNKFPDDFIVQTTKCVDEAMKIHEIYVPLVNKMAKLKTLSNVEKENFILDYWYPIDFENKLINVIINGMKDHLDETKQLFFEKNSDTLNSPQSLKGLYSELKGTLVKLLKMNSVDISAEVIGRPASEDYAENINYVFGIFSEICNQNAVKKKNKDSQLYEDIKAYLKKNYWNQEMSLALIGEKFNVSETYVSVLFKKNDDNYAAFLEKVRMESACKLLLSEKIKMVEVAEIVGYNSDQSFRRAFKRLYGISPKEYKELYNIKER